jgi:predicted RNA-binding Zn-ribbon protein involved in translation (DUF1610 family)
MISISFERCPDCGHQFETTRNDIKHDAAPADNEVLSNGVVTDTEIEVTDVSYRVHTKRNASPDTPKTMRVTYTGHIIEQEDWWVDEPLPEHTCPNCEDGGRIRVMLARAKPHKYEASCDYCNKWIKWLPNRKHGDIPYEYSEWICVEHNGFAGEKARKWWKSRSMDLFPESAQHAVEIAEAGGLADVKSITVREKSGEKYPQIIGWDIGEIPPPVAIEEPSKRIEVVDEWGMSKPQQWSQVNEDEVPF